ncbi:THAP domain-containing protein 9 [Plakobranchus ocellatus]|uniref:THAP domain-containing protein 9 n=1 Tax=Plakobranchus ocellatus TaxID=259542 RepID=A0AAV4DEM9_9GAST|nr:THAP domain-containing protein 9 [Plakobranchus ocellatus]
MASRSENKLLKEKLKRRDTKCGNLVQQLKEQKLLSSEAADLLHMNFSEETLSLINNELQASASTTSKTHRYSEAVKEFSVTVHFYSPKAYDYLRGILHLPHPSLIRQWAASMDCEPGFLKDVLNKLGQELTDNTDMRDVCVMFDAMSIKKECVYDGKTGSFAGGVNFAKYMDSKSEMATEALFFMVVGVKGRWKMPFGYFLRKAGGEMQGQLVKDAVCLLSEKGFNVIAVTCDGSYANQKIATLLGCSLDVNSLKSSFPHPDDPCKEVFFLFDACHLLKNVRNCIGDLKILKQRPTN